MRKPVRRAYCTTAIAALAAIATPAFAQSADPTEAAFRATYRELIETNTTLSVGSCTLAAERMRDRLAAAGYPASDLHMIVEPAHPREGNLVAILPGSDPSAGALLLLAHIDVVEANRADWERDPFTLVEEDGYFYARGAIDDKAQAAVWVDTLIRLRQEGFTPRRTIKLALTCGEETAGAFNGAEYLVNTHRDLIDADLALNEGAAGILDRENGNRLMLNIQAGEKLPQNYTLEVTNPGGHSSRPVADNAINRMGVALGRVSQLTFPWKSNDATLGFFGAMAQGGPAPLRPAFAAFVANPASAEAAATLAAADPSFNSILHTTCIATMIEGGHATNALPQRVRANINCRIFPGESAEEVRQALIGAIGDDAVSVTIPNVRSAASAPPPLNEAIMGPVRRAAEAAFPGVPLVPMMAAGGTDAAFTTPAGIPTYGFSGFFIHPETTRAHGLNERIPVQSLLDGRRMLYGLVKDLAD